MSNNSLAISTAQLTPTTFEQCVAFSERMSEAKLLPAHLRGSPADCLRVVLQAARWEMDPFSVADKTSLISGKLMYEGQLVSAVVNARGNLSSRLNYDFKGEGKNRVLTVRGTLKGEDAPREIELTHEQACRINKNGQMNQNPDQQMCYIGARIWARRHMPELMLGVYTPDEMPDDGEPVNVTGTGEPTASAPERPAPKPRAAKGAAAAKAESQPDNSAIDISATPAVATTAAQPESKAEEPPAKPTPAAAEQKKAPDAKAAKEPVRALKAGETNKFICNVIDVTTKMVKVAGVPQPTVIAEIAGEYVGKVYHFGGATVEGEALKADPAWQLNQPVEITLFGREQSNGAVVSTVSAIAIAEEF